METSFQLIKELANLSANLVTFDESKEVLIGTDASAVGLGYWQGQVKDKFKSVKSSILMPHQIEIVEFGSIAFNNALRHASATKKELSAVDGTYSIHDTWFPGSEILGWMNLEASYTCKKYNSDGLDLKYTVPNRCTNCKIS